MAAAQTRRISRAAHRRNGFTLAEVLVASILISIVMTSVYTLFYSAIGSWRAVETDFDAYQDARNALSVMTMEMDNLLAGAAHLFEGKDDEITFFIISAPMNVEDSEGPHLMRVQYSYKSGKDAVVREEGLVTTALPKSPPEGQDLDRTRIEVSDEKDFILATGVEKIHIRYIWMPVPEQRNIKLPPTPVEPVYMEEHHERWGLPQGIEVRLDFKDPKDKNKKMSVTSTIPVRAPNRRLTKKELDVMLKDAK